MKAIEAGNEMAALAMPKSEPVTHHIHATLNPTAETAAIIAHRYGCFEIERANIQAKTNAMAISGDDPIRSIRAHHRPSLPKRRSGRKPAPKLMRTAKMTRTRFKTAKGIVASTVLKCRISETFANRSARKKPDVCNWAEAVSLVLVESCRNPTRGRGSLSRQRR